MTIVPAPPVSSRSSSASAVSSRNSTTSSADRSSLRNRSAMAAETACADAAISSSRRSKTAWTTRSPSRSVVMSMCCRSICLSTTVSANRGPVVMCAFLPANSEKSHGSVARMNRFRKRVEHGDQPALVLEREEGLGESPPPRRRIDPRLHLDERLVLSRREREARPGAGHRPPDLPLLHLREPLDDPDGVDGVHEPDHL